MQRNLLLAMGSLVVIGLAAVSLISLSTPKSSYAAGMAAMSIDMNITGNTASGLPVGHTEVLGTLQSCARINENGIQDADETGVDTLTIDITALSIPASDPIIAFAFAFEFPSASILVATEDQAFLLNALPGSTSFPASDALPDSASPWNATGADIADPSTTAESGSGVLDRLEIQTSASAATGVFPLSLSGAGHVRPDNTGVAPVTVNNAQVAINQDCPSNVQGDVDCSKGTTPVSATDALKVLRYVAGLSVSQTPPCNLIGTGGPPVQGDVDCSAGTTPVSATDALKILRYVAGLSVSQQPGCPLIGT